ncbi:mobile mystery protein B [Parasphingorhabdus sp.]|uniref:mobile mystery protein B n=1 Tax=Parasphingorhabdus sp. TaxID=2709688 RepID=UPI003002651C
MSPAGEEPDGATPLDPDEREGLRFRHVTTRADLNHLEQVNVQSGLAWLNRRRMTDSLTEAFIRELHRQLFGGVWRWAGSFRLTEKNIGVDPIQISVQLRALLDDARFWAENATYAPLEAGARFHHRLVKIHLFANGNGRHARIAADQYLRWHFNHPPIDWEAGHDLESISARRTAYILALRAADAREYTALFRFVGLER